MDAKELRTLGEEFVKTLLEHKNIKASIFQFGRIVSYLESEQAKRKELGENMSKLSELLMGINGTPGVMERLRKIEERSTRNGKLLLTVLGSVLTAITLQVIRLLK